VSMILWKASTWRLPSLAPKKSLCFFRARSKNLSECGVERARTTRLPATWPPAVFLLATATYIGLLIVLAALVWSPVVIIAAPLLSALSSPAITIGVGGGTGIVFSATVWAAVTTGLIWPVLDGARSRARATLSEMKHARFEEAPSGLSSIERVSRFMKALVAVPKKELNEKCTVRTPRQRRTPRARATARS
jgi:hypothetical protein